MKQPCVIAPSLLAANMVELGREVSRVLDGGAEWIHFDVMDNHYVPNLTMGPEVCKALIKNDTRTRIDAHLMVTPVDELIERFADVGVRGITIHPDSTPHPHRALRRIRELGCRSGLAFNPGAPLSVLEELIPEIDLVLIMSVNPGFGGQKFIPASLNKIRRVREFLDQFDAPVRLQVDGGIDLNNIADVAAAGADTFVAGTSIFSADNYIERIRELRTLAEGAAQQRQKPPPAAAVQGKAPDSPEPTAEAAAGTAASSEETQPQSPSAESASSGNSAQGAASETATTPSAAQQGAEPKPPEAGSVISGESAQGATSETATTPSAAPQGSGTNPPASEDKSSETQSPSHTSLSISV